MKYIRTAIDTIEMLVYEDTDGIITEKYDEFGNEVASKMEFSWIKKRANNIEDLCDVFVSVRDNWYDQWDNFEEPKTLCSESDVYGAIWTNKGLIYVAKMNENGELELFYDFQY